MADELRSILKSMSKVKEVKTNTRNTAFSRLRATSTESTSEKERWKKLMEAKKKRDAERKAAGLPEEF